MRSCLLWHPGASVSTCDVAAGMQYGLEQHGVEVIAYNAEAEIKVAKVVLDWLWNEKGNPPQLRPTDADRLYRAGKAVVADAARARLERGVQWVIVVSGMYQHPDFFVLLRSCGFKVPLACTETPYDIEYELRASKHADVVFTNERSAVSAFRDVCRHVAYLPHAWHPGVHDVMGVGQATEQDVPSHDVVFVGTYFRERLDFLADINWTGIDLGLYGGTDELDRRTRAGKKLSRFVAGGYTLNTRTAALYRKAKVGLNLNRMSKGYGPQAPQIAHAESMNPRCYELAATGCYFVTDARAEAREVFGSALATFSTPEECEQVIRQALADDVLRQRRAVACQQAVMTHSWRERAGIIVNTLMAFDAQRERAA